MTQQMISAFFDSRPEAVRAVDELVKAGIPRSSVRLLPETDTPATKATGSYDRNRDDKGFWASLGDFFLPDNDRHTYAEAMHRGSIMVSAAVDPAHGDKAEAILEKHGTVNIDEREASWRKEGWNGYPAGSAVAGAGKTTSTPLPGSPASNEGGIIPVVEEQLKVGRRQVTGGRVKVRSYVVETPVQEQVNLRTESVNVDRRPADRAVAAEEDAFRERTVEAHANSEEAIVSKTARVTGEVVVKKEAGQRIETVSDTVRSTKVDVEDERAPAARR
ncbi:MAG TPA: YsnF/AvaK domain-containing protein [Xanthobacteraceae bacterium]|jgi:uncharacterized protein (TIGR02271 family)|nr:YsnF/AvaK domain-containing protein [Xanthobacteraceae bacterium]